MFQISRESNSKENNKKDIFHSCKVEDQSYSRRKYNQIQNNIFCSKSNKNDSIPKSKVLEDVLNEQRASSALTFENAFKWKVLLPVAVLLKGPLLPRSGIEASAIMQSPGLCPYRGMGNNFETYQRCCQHLGRPVKHLQGSQRRFSQRKDAITTK